MALNASQQWWNRTDGDNTNGGGFDPDHVSVVYNAVAQTLALSARFGEGVIATAGGGTPFASGDVGKMILDVTTNSGGLAQITAFSSSTVVTVRILRPFIGVSIASSSWKLSDQINYNDQAAAQLSLSDLTSTASTTITSVVGGFTSAMIGNVLRLASGAGTTPGYYVITARTDTNTITVDAASGTYTLGVGKIGGAFATLEPLMGTGNGGLNTPAITSPLAAGHTINVRGLGSDDPSAIDYNYKGTTTDGYWSSNPNGSSAAGHIVLRGYNGRPLIQHSGLLVYAVTYWHLENLKFKLVASASTFLNYGIIGMDANLRINTVRNVIVDLNGSDGVGIGASTVVDCEVRNTGGGAAGTAPAIYCADYGGEISGNTIVDVRGNGIQSAGQAPLASSSMTVVNNIISNVGGDGIKLNHTSYGSVVVGNTIDGCGGDAIEVSEAAMIDGATIKNNIISNNTGYGIKCSTGTTALNDRRSTGKIDYNNIYNNTAGAYNGISAGAHDTYLDPQYTNAGALDFSVGANMKAIGFPGAFRGTTTTGYLDLGAAQRQEAGGTAGGHVIGGGVG